MRLTEEDIEDARGLIEGCKVAACQLENPPETTLAFLRLGKTCGGRITRAP